MSLHKLSAGGGVDYLLKHTCCGDASRDAATPLSAYYIASGYPAGRWMGRGLAGAASGRGISGVVEEEAMSRLFGLGLDPVTGEALGGLWRVHRTAAQRIAQRIHDLPAELLGTDREQELSRITEQENDRKTPIAVTGFDLTFTLPKSASVLWALADPGTQTRIAKAHNEAVNDCLALIETHALFTRTGKNGIAQQPTRGALAVGFDHWDTRAGDPNLHTHLVIANKVQGSDGGWRTIDAKGLYAATVAISEFYDALAADKIAAATGTRWSVRTRGERSALFEIDGVSTDLLAEFSHRSLQIEASLRTLLTDFHARNARSPTRAEMLRIRQHATRLSRPVKQLRPLPELLARWRDRATSLLPTSIEEWVTRVTSPRPIAIRADDLSEAQLLAYAKATVDEATTRRSTWTRWNLLAEAARATKPLRMANTADRIALLERVAELAITRFCLALTPPDLTITPQHFLRPDGASAFRRHRAEVFTSPLILAAEDRLLDAARDTTSARASTGDNAVPGMAGDDGQLIVLAADQAFAVRAITGSGRRLDVLVGPAGSGKTTTMRALRQVWETDHGPGSVIGLAPSAAAARELAAALGIGCENTAKWIYETTGDRPAQRRAALDQLRGRRHLATAAGHGQQVARIDAHGTTLAALDRHFRLREGQLLIVDEASLAGTLILDELLSQAGAAGAKVLLVGDHRQLSAVEAGGAFGLVSTETSATELTSLWRFRQLWEARATQALRVGDPAVIDTYADNNRLHEGPAEVMASDAYRAWAGAVRDGKRALLIAPDNATVAALNDQARIDRLVAGEVEAGGAQLHDGTQAGAGDIVVTRANNRAIRTSAGAWVRNGDLWTVIARGDDGALTVRRNRDHAESIDRESIVTLDSGYVAAHVELGYATTAHRAQGMTVDAAFALLRPGMAREVAYVAMTRGRETNQAFIATDIPDPDYDGAHTPAVTGRQVFEQILATQGAQLSATQTLRQLHHQTESLATLCAIHETLVQAATKERWQTLITGALPPDVAQAVLTSPAYGALVAAMRRAEHDGLHIGAAFRALAAGPLTTGAGETGTNPAAGGVRDPAALLHWRVDNYRAQARRTGGHGGLLAGVVTPAGPTLAHAEPETRDAIADVENRINARAGVVTRELIDTPPPWLRRLGPLPAEPRAAARWRAAIGAIAIYRDTYAITDTARPLGSTPPTDTEQRDARRRAIAAARQVVRSTPHLAPAGRYDSTERTPSL